ncbi:hydrogen peroxide-dependent heme synthase [Streptomyces sp. BI20]|uniref:hydrogen peroxide-dependent heme synthase n=1 Tax=Streptomyces sp. BI20 TaxID=3403460 RepID=UPI003C77552D
MTAPEKIPNAGKKAKDLNEVIRYTLWSVFKLKDVLPVDRAGFADEVQELFDQLAAKDIVVRGSYDVSGLRADADVMIWWHAETADELQGAYNLFRRTRLGRHLEPVWSNMALHRPAEFNKSHIPAFLADEVARDYVSVYPFVRSYDWYLLPDEDRRRMLADHGKMARGFPDVRANTVASFSLGDYEWLLAFEADELYRIVDLMRHLRASEARMHVREEVPFYTGRRKSVADLVDGLA